MNNPNKPYNKQPVLPPNLALTPKIYNKTISANKALAELKGMAGQIPNQVIFLNSLVLREAKDSSEIENIVTTHDEFIQRIRSLFEKTIEKVKSKLPKIYSKELVEVLFHQVPTSFYLKPCFVHQNHSPSIWILYGNSIF